MVRFTLCLIENASEKHLSAEIAMRCIYDAMEEMLKGITARRHFIAKFHSLPSKGRSTKSLTARYGMEIPTCLM
jgi:hypothetical protein